MKRNFIFTFIVAAIVGGFLAEHHVVRRKPTLFVSPVKASTVAPVSTSQSEDVLATDHPVFTEGVPTLKDLARAIKKYPDLYRGFDVGSATLIRLDKSLFAFSAYRIGDKIFFTKHALLIPAGSLVWKDGNGFLVEAKCGNVLHPVDDTIPDVSQAPTFFSDLIPPQDAPSPIPPVTSYEPPTPIPPMSFIPPPPDGPIPPYPPFFPCCVTDVSPPPISTPEPSTFAFLVFGLAAVISKQNRRKQ